MTNAESHGALQAGGFTTAGLEVSYPATVTEAPSTETGNRQYQNNTTTTNDTGLHYYHRQSHNSSKLPAFRFADLNTASNPVSHHPHRTVSSTVVSPNPGPSDEIALPPIPNSVSLLDEVHQSIDSVPAAAATTTANTPTRPTARRSSTHDFTSSPATLNHPADFLQRSTSYPVTDNIDQTLPQLAAAIAPQFRRAPASRSSLGASISDGTSSPLKRRRGQAANVPSSTVTTPETLSPIESQGQRELLLPKRLSLSSLPDDRRVSTSTHHRPPVSYKPPANAPPSTAAPVRVPPIRSFRSSGSRKSLALDMNFKSLAYDNGDDGETDNFDRTLRALEGRQVQDIVQMTPPGLTRHDSQDADDGGDVFLKIAREEASRRVANETGADETQSTVSRVARSSHRRPYSTNVASYQPSSPPQVSRRLSDQQETSRSRYDDDRASEISQLTSQRVSVREKAASAHPGDDIYRFQGVGPLRPSPITPRSAAHQDPKSFSPAHTRRRSSITDQATTPIRQSAYKTTPGHHYGKSYNSSPLVRSFDFGTQGQNHETTPGVEGTESTGSTTAPSTVWDELDDLKSRLHRLELTGKLPSTSAAAVSRLSDERPPTATTTVTTMSSSPKRNTGQQADASSTTSSQREAHHLLTSALTKSKPFLNPEVFRALESAANDAMALSSIMGSPGQPGPISSGASTIGSGVTISDRQLRRKADSVCRSITELCVALGEDIAAANTRQQPPPAPEPIKTQHQLTYHAEGPTTPTVTTSYSGLPSSRRPSLASDQLSGQRANTSPSRAMSKFEERRNTLLNGNALPPPRMTGPSSQLTTPQESTGQRRSSLMVSRTRRAGTEEPEEGGGRRSSLLLRTRRAGTEEPEEGRKTSMFRSRRGTTGEGEEESNVRYGAPSRAYTEVATSRGPARDYTSHAKAQTQSAAHKSVVEAPAQTATSALPRRRFASSSVGASRLVPPSTHSTLTTPPTARRYYDRPVQDQNNNAVIYNAERLAEDRARRHLSPGGGVSLNRAASLSTRRLENRDSSTTIASNAATAGGTSYR